jgi:hypothetical protein
MAHNWAERGLGAPPIRLASHIHTRSMSLPEYVPTDTPTLSIDDQHSLLDDDESQLITPPVSGQLLVAPMGALHLGLPRKSRSMRSRRSVASVTSSDADAAGLTPKRQRTREYVPRPPGDVVQICLVRERAWTVS